MRRLMFLCCSLWAGALFTYTLDEEYHDAVRSHAFDYFSQHWGERLAPELFTTGRIRETMELFGHGPLPESDFRFGMEE